jgi:hypothetical protein
VTVLHAWCFCKCRSRSKYLSSLRNEKFPFTSVQLSPYFGFLSRKERKEGALCCVCRIWRTLVGDAIVCSQGHSIPSLLISFKTFAFEISPIITTSPKARSGSFSCYVWICLQRVRTTDILIHATPYGWLCWTSSTAWAVYRTRPGTKTGYGRGRLIRGAFCIPNSYFAHRYLLLLLASPGGRLSCLLDLKSIM